MLSNYPDILTSEDICTLLKISKNTLYKLIHSGQLKAKKVARHYRIPKSELLNYIHSI
ncbi:helix-turn-helix domain-containing protein [Lachnospiraceae bacterium 38-14]